MEPQRLTEWFQRTNVKLGACYATASVYHLTSETQIRFYNSIADPRVFYGDLRIAIPPKSQESSNMSMSRIISF